MPNANGTMYPWETGPTPGGSTATTTGGTGWGKWIPVFGAVASGVLNWLSNKEANAANARAVDKQLAFQKEQSETQYQRAVNDLRNAGLNPALAYKQGGNAAESGAAANYNAANLSQAVEAYNQFANGTAQRELIRQQSAATYAQARKTIFEGNVIGLDSDAAIDKNYQGDYRRTKFAELAARRFTADNVSKRFEADVGYTHQASSTAKAQEDLMRTQATLNEQQFQNEWFRKNIAPFINSTAKTLDLTRAATGLRGMYR